MGQRPGREADDVDVVIVELDARIARVGASDVPDHVGQLARLVEENVRNRTTLAEEMRVAVGQLADRFAEADRDAMALHRRTIEGHLARLVEDTGTNRTANQAPDGTGDPVTFRGTLLRATHDALRVSGMRDRQ